jgi:hypothetical protein
VYGANYLLWARDFEIPVADVDTLNKAGQILTLSGAYAYCYDGTRVGVSVTELGGYTNVAGLYVPTICVSADSGVWLRAKALVLAPTWVYSVSFDANGGSLLGPSSIAVVSPANTIAYMPVSPVRNGYSFVQWTFMRDGGGQYTSDFVIEGDLTVFALWEKLPEVLPPEPPVIVVTNPPANPPARPPVIVVTNPPAQIVVSPPPVVPVTTEPDTTVIDEPEPPITSANNEPGWALFNVCAMIISLLILLVLAVKTFAQLRRDEGEGVADGESGNASAAAATGGASRAGFGGAVAATAGGDGAAAAEFKSVARASRKGSYMSLPVLVIVAAAFVEGLTILLMTQNFAGSRMMVDQYSIPLSLVVFVQILAPAMAAIMRSNNSK